MRDWTNVRAAQPKNQKLAQNSKYIESHWVEVFWQDKPSLIFDLLLKFWSKRIISIWCYCFVQAFLISNGSLTWYLIKITFSPYKLVIMGKNCLFAFFNFLWLIDFIFVYCRVTKHILSLKWIINNFHQDSLIFMTKRQKYQG